jgi:transcriptional regulator with XRE-family HTH domain
MDQAIIHPMVLTQLIDRCVRLMNHVRIMNAENSLRPRTPQESLQHALGMGIVRQRQRKGWSQAGLAERLKVSRHRLGKWELGLAPPSLADLVALMELLGVTFEELALGRAAPAAPLPPPQRTELAKCLNGLLRVVRPLVERPNGAAGVERESRRR